MTCVATSQLCVTQFINQILMKSHLTLFNTGWLFDQKHFTRVGGGKNTYLYNS